jgi:hypothetical protein
VFLVVIFEEADGHDLPDFWLKVIYMTGWPGSAIIILSYASFKRGERTWLRFIDDFGQSDNTEGIGDEKSRAEQVFIYYSTLKYNSRARLVAEECVLNLSAYIFRLKVFLTQNDSIRTTQAVNDHFRFCKSKPGAWTRT